LSSISDAKSTPSPKPKIVRKCTAFLALQIRNSPTRFREDPKKKGNPGPSKRVGSRSGFFRTLPALEFLILNHIREQSFENNHSRTITKNIATPRATQLLTWPTARFPSPVGGEAHSMPTHDGLGPDDGYGVKNARAATIKPDEESAVDPTQMQSTWRTLLQDAELMPQHQDFGFELPSRLETVPQHADQKKANHQPQSCSDSVTAATPADGVFGTDRCAFVPIHRPLQSAMGLPLAAPVRRSKRGLSE
jgi:hypothetical protein